MAKVTLVLASGPGFPQGDPECRYEIEVTLDATYALTSLEAVPDEGTAPDSAEPAA